MAKKKDGLPRRAPVSDPSAKTRLDESEDQQFYEELNKELEHTKKELAKSVSIPHPKMSPGKSWDLAHDIVSQVRPVSKAVWVMVRAVFSQPGTIRDAHPGVFFALDRLLYHAATQRPFLTKKEKLFLPDVVKLLGVDVAAALCYLHAACRRISTAVEEHNWRPIIQEALRRAQIGYYLGAESVSFGRGRCMIAGFTSEVGFAVQLVTATAAVRQSIHEQLKVKKKPTVRDVARQTFHCEPLQIASIMLAAAGCGKEAALGVASLLSQNDELDPASEEFRWVAAIKTIEMLSSGKAVDIPAKFWDIFELADEDKRDQVLDHLKNVDRKGFAWDWLTWPQKWMVAQ